jgi:hypothetical protein
VHRPQLHIQQQCWLLESANMPVWCAMIRFMSMIIIVNVHLLYPKKVHALLDHETQNRLLPQGLCSPDD